jgi:hypothetical protein
MAKFADSVGGEELTASWASPGIVVTETPDMPVEIVPCETAPTIILISYLPHDLGACGFRSRIESIDV